MINAVIRKALLLAKGMSSPPGCVATRLGTGGRSRAGDEGGAEGRIYLLEQDKNSLQF